MLEPTKTKINKMTKINKCFRTGALKVHFPAKFIFNLDRTSPEELD